MDGWKVIPKDPHQAWLQLELWNGDNGADAPSYSVGIKFDGCVHVTRYYNGERKDSDYMHICDLDEFIELLQDIKKKRTEHFPQHTHLH